MNIQQHGRKHSYVRVEDDQPGCIWTVFRMINHHPWHNVKKFPKMLPWHKPRDKSSYRKELKPEEENEISKTLELDDDAIVKYASSVDSGSSRAGSTSKRSIKARIRALMKDKHNSSTKSDIQEQNSLLGNEENFGYDTSAPTLMSLLKANPKLIKSVRRVDDSKSVKHKDYTKKQDDYVGVLELFNVDQDLFLKILDDVSPRKPRKPRLVKSGTFPSLNPKPPSKIEHKHNEVWPATVSNDRELRKVKSQGMIARSSSLTDSLERHGYLFDRSSNKAIKKHLSKSLRLSNEKEFLLLEGLQGRRSFKDRLYLPESESYTIYTTGEPLHNKSDGELKGLRVESPRVSENYSTKSLVDEQKQNLEEQIDTTTMNSNCETNDELTSVSAQEVGCQEDEIEIVDWPLPRESILETNNTRDSNHQFLADYYDNEDLQYVKFVLDIIGFAMGENQRKDWHDDNQPLDPALFDGIEVCCPFEPKTSNKDVMCMSSYHRKLLFDLLNEALIDIYEKSYANYYPKALSYWCHVCPKKKTKSGDFEEVWEFVREHLSCRRPELDPTLDVAMAHDLSKDKNGWVNLQLESESLGLEVEDLIFNELLDEIVSY